MGITRTYLEGWGERKNNPDSTVKKWTGPGGEHWNVGSWKVGLLDSLKGHDSTDRLVLRTKVWNQNNTGLHRSEPRTWATLQPGAHSSMLPYTHGQGGSRAWDICGCSPSVPRCTLSSPIVSVCSPPWTAWTCCVMFPALWIPFQS
jgi:hypothetical protein